MNSFAEFWDSITSIRWDNFNWSDIAEIIGKKNWGRGIKITISENNSLRIDCNVNIGYGESVVDVAKSIQEAVTNAVEAVTGVSVKDVHVNVCGIVRK